MKNVFEHLRVISIERAKVWHKGQDISVTFRATELAGEVGEVCNAVKKLARHEMGLVGGVADINNLRDELADVIICVDLLAARYDIDLWKAVCAKFNATSIKHGFPHFLSETQSPRFFGDLKDPPFDGELKPPGHSDWEPLPKAGGES